MIKAVIIGFAHMHVNEIAMYIDGQPDTQLVAIADVRTEASDVPPYRFTPDWNLALVKEKYCSKVYDSYTEMLDREKPDYAYILTENCQKADVVIECAKRGVNVCIEKPMADNYQNAKRIERAVLESGIEAVVNWPIAWSENVLRVAHIVESGILGAPLRMRYLNGHTGPLGKGATHRGAEGIADEISDEIRGKTWWHQASHGGGVLLDICCYGCILTRWMLGTGAKSVSALAHQLNTPFGDVPDNASAIIDFGDKMSTIEATWTLPRHLIPAGPTVICENGVVTCRGYINEPSCVKAYDMFGNEVDVKPFEPTDKYNNMPWHLANHIKTGEPVQEIVTLKANMEMMRILDGVLRSYVSGETEKLI